MNLSSLQPCNDGWFNLYPERAKPCAGSRELNGAERLPALISFLFFLLITALLAGPIRLQAAPLPDEIAPNTPVHATSSLADFSSLLEAPAGRHGFLSVGQDGHFYFRDGTRARFWGINVAGRSVFQSPETITRVVDTFAHAGINLVRLHDIDDVGGVIDYSSGGSRRLSAPRLKQLDLWIARCRERGIYVYLDLLDYRTFSRQDGVPNAALLGRAAKPYAVFDARLIALQKEYAFNLLVRHVNKFTNLPYASDPTVCLLELFDENGLFIKRPLFREMPWPYRQNLFIRWNGWLKDHYGSTAALRHAWTNYEGRRALQPGENLETANVKLPSLLLDAAWDRPYSNATQSPARVNDAALFAYSVQVNYCYEMKNYLRRIGVQVPITTVGAEDVIPDLKSVADGLDFIGNNFYWDHPRYRGAAWRGPSFFTGANPISSMGDHSFAPTVAFCKVRGKPLVIREWNYCWPNNYRSTGMVEATAYACLQDVDAMILFTYDAGPGTDGLSYFDVSHDPARWSLVGPMAAVFLKHLVRPAERLVDVAYANADTFHYHGYLGSTYGTAWVSRVQNVFFHHWWKRDDSDLVVSSGHSAMASYPGKHIIIRTNDRYEGSAGPVIQATSAYRSGYGMWLQHCHVPFYVFGGNIYPARTSRYMGAGWRYRTRAVLNAHYTPLGTTPDGTYCLGFYDPHRQNYVFQDLDEANTLRVALNALSRWYRVPDDWHSVQRDRFISDTGELVRNSAAGTLHVETPQFAAVAGRIHGTSVSGPLRVQTGTSAGVVYALALDGLPLLSSHHLLISLVGDAANTGQMTGRLGAGAYPNKIIQAGAAPVISAAHPSPQPTQVWIGDRLLASVYLRGGVWMV
nr:hypothetical protein [Armatimonadota bacterium]